MSESLIQFDIYDVELELTEPLLGTVPKNPKVYKEFIEKNKPKEIEEDESENIPDSKEESGWTGFMEDKHGTFLYDYQCKGFLKEAGNILKNQIDIKALKSKVQRYVFVEPRRIYISKPLKEGEALEVLERPLRAETMQGPRVTLARSDMIPAGTKIKFQVKLLKGPVTEKALRIIFAYGELCGLGQWRSGGYGRIKLNKFKKVQG